MCWTPDEDQNVETSANIADCYKKVIKRSTILAVNVEKQSIEKLANWLLVYLVKIKHKRSIFRCSLYRKNKLLLLILAQNYDSNISRQLFERFQSFNYTICNLEHL